MMLMMMMTMMMTTMMLMVMMMMMMMMIIIIIGFVIIIIIIIIIIPKVVGRPIFFGSICCEDVNIWKTNWRQNGSSRGWFYFYFYVFTSYKISLAQFFFCFLQKKKHGLKPAVSCLANMRTWSLDDWLNVDKFLLCITVIQLLSIQTTAQVLSMYEGVPRKVNKIKTCV